MGEPKTDHIIIHGHRLNRIGAVYFPSGFKDTAKAPWWVEKMFGRDVWILRRHETAAIYYFSMKQALLQATRTS